MSVEAWISLAVGVLGAVFTAWRMVTDAKKEVREMVDAKAADLLQRVKEGYADRADVARVEQRISSLEESVKSMRTELSETHRDTSHTRAVVERIWLEVRHSRSSLED